MNKLFLFDIDGTILQLKMGKSRQIFADVFHDVFGSRIEDSQIPNFGGMSDLQILGELGDIAGIPFDDIHSRRELIWSKLLEQFETVCTADNMEIFPGVAELIEELSRNKDIRLALLSGNFKENAYLKLRHFGLDKHFPFGAFGSDNRLRRALPPIALSRANDYEGKPIYSKENTLIIGDGPRDWECAKVNGLKVALVATGHHNIDQLGKLGPDYLFEDFSDWKNVLEMILSF